MTRRTPASATRRAPGPGSRGAARAAASATWARAGHRCGTSARSRASERSRSRPPGPTCGSAATRAGTCRRPAAMHAGASSTSTTPTGERCATRRSSTAWRISATALPGLRERIDADLGRSGLPRERVLAAVGTARRRHAHPRRQRAVPARQRLVRRHDDQAAPRQRRGLARERRVPGQGRQAAARRGDRSPPGPHGAAAARPARARAVRVPGWRGRAPPRALRGRECLSAGRQRRGPDGQGLPHVGRQRALATGAQRSGQTGLGGRGQALRSTRRSARSRTLSATPRRCAGRRTSILRCSRPTPRASCRRRRSAGCTASTAGSPPCCASCAPVHDVAPTLSISDSISASALLVRLDRRAASTSASSRSRARVEISI